MGLPNVTMEARVAFDPELRFTPSGAAVCELRCVANSRKFNQDTQEWEDDKACWISVTVWRQLAENVAESIEKGMLVSVTGKLVQEEWETQEGEKRSVHKILGDTVAPSLRWATAKVTKAGRSGASSSSAAAASGGGDPWATPSSESPPEEPPF